MDLSPFSLLDEMQTEGYGSKRTLTFQPTKRHQAVAKLQISLVAECANLRVMNIVSETTIATIRVTPVGRHLLQNGVVNWLDGNEDFGVSSRHSGLKRSELGELDRTSGELWFWGPTLIGP